MNQSAPSSAVNSEFNAIMTGSDPDFLCLLSVLNTEQLVRIRYRLERCNFNALARKISVIIAEREYLGIECYQDFQAEPSYIKDIRALVASLSNKKGVSSKS